MWVHAMTTTGHHARCTSRSNSAARLQAILVAIALLAVVSPARAGLRILVQLAGLEPPVAGDVPLELEVGACQTLTFDLYIADTALSPPLRELDIMMPCNIPGGTSGSVGFNGSLNLQPEREDSVRAGLRCSGGANYGRRCLTGADCPGAPFSCEPFQVHWAHDLGSCPAEPPPAFGNPAMSYDFLGPYLRVDTEPVFLGSFQYDVSADAVGEFFWELSEEAGVYVEAGGGSVPAITLPTIQIRVANSGCADTDGQCCVGSRCVHDGSDVLCAHLGGSWFRGSNCDEPCSCEVHSDCSRGQHCSVNRCVDNRCVSTPAEFGDVDGLGPAHPNLGDILCALQAMSDIEACPDADLFPWCVGDGIVDELDLQVLQMAFGGFRACGCGGDYPNAQTRMYLEQPQPGVHPPPVSVTLDVDGGDFFTLWAMVEGDVARIRGVQATVPCSAVGGTAGVVAFVPPPFIDTTNPAFVFYGYNSYPVVDSGTCPAPPPPAYGNPRFAVAAVYAFPNGPPSQPYIYFGEVYYVVSLDAAGAFQIDLPNEPDSAIRDYLDMPVPFTTSGVTIRIRTGRCCISGVCAEGLTRYQCESQAGDWAAGLLCDDGCR